MSTLSKLERSKSGRRDLKREEKEAAAETKVEEEEVIGSGTFRIRLTGRPWREVRSGEGNGGSGSGSGDGSGCGFGPDLGFLDLGFLCLDL